MASTLFESTVYAHPNDPVEFLVAIGETTTRVAIEWSMIERLIGTSPVGEAQVRDFLHLNREAITLAIQAHVFAQGLPLSRYLVMSADDFEIVAPMAH
jgi:hypothetical protein